MDTTKRLFGFAVLLTLIVAMSIQVSLAEVVNGAPITSSSDYLSVSTVDKFLVDEDTRLRTTALIVLSFWEHGSAYGNIRDDFYADLIGYFMRDITKCKIYMGSPAGERKINAQLVHVIMFEDCKYLVQTGTLTGEIQTSQLIESIEYKDMENYFKTLFGDSLDPYYEVDSVECMDLISLALQQIE